MALAFRLGMGKLPTMDFGQVNNLLKTRLVKSETMRTLTRR